MLNIKKLVFISALCIAVTLSGMLTASAAVYNLPPSFLIGDQDGIKVSVDGRYYINVDNLMPGDTINKTLTLRNTEDNQAYKITMTAEPLFTTGPVDLLDRVHLELKLGDNVLYIGRLRGDDDVNMIYNALDLGVYEYGDEAVLHINMTVDSDFDIGWEESVAEFRWHFYAVRDNGTKPPDTGVYIQYSLYIITAAMLITASVLLIIYKIRKNNQLKNEEK